MPTDLPPVADAFEALIAALAAEALRDPAAFERAAAFRQAVLALQARWENGDPPHRRRAAGAGGR
jgi:hypothetical protein